MHIACIAKSGPEVRDHEVRLRPARQARPARGRGREQGQAVYDVESLKAIMRLS
jgi:hypothetical protein